MSDSLKTLSHVPMAILTAIIVGLCALTVLPGVGHAAERKTSPMSAEAAGLKKTLEQKFPGAEIRGIVRTPYFGLRGKVR